MSDLGREGITDKAQKNLTPDSEKSYLDKAKDSATSAGDSVASTLQPEGEKSTTQKLSDATGSGTNDAEKQGKTYLESAQETVGDLSKQASDTISGLADNISGSAKK